VADEEKGKANVIRNTFFPRVGTDLGLIEEVITQCWRGSLSVAHQGASGLFESILRITHCSMVLAN
jgi:hypothetical protein